MIHIFLGVRAKLQEHHLEIGTLKKHLKNLLLLQRQEKTVENEIEKLKDKIYRVYCIFSYCTMHRKGLHVLPDDKRLKLLTTGDLHSTPFGNLEKENRGISNTDDIKGNIVAGNGQSYSNNEKRSINDINVKLNTIRNIENLSSWTRKSNITRLINWRIENHGKQTIILL